MGISLFSFLMHKPLMFSEKNLKPDPYYCRTQSHQLNSTQYQIKSSSTKSTLVSVLTLECRGLVILGYYCIVVLMNYWMMNFAAISNSFGFGGHNSVVAFSAFKPWSSSQRGEGGCLNQVKCICRSHSFSFFSFRRGGRGKLGIASQQPDLLKQK